MFTLPELPYAVLDGFMSEETLAFHHGKHHAGYVTKLNAAIEQAPEYQQLLLEDVIKKSFAEKHMGIFNNAAQHFNHAFFWNCFSAETSEMPESFASLLEKSFGSVDAFKEKFSQMATTLFGSGWVWLVQKQDGSLDILDLSNAGTPITEGVTPLLTIDVWEHAYYIDYRNARPSYIQAFWQAVDWNIVASRLQ